MAQNDSNIFLALVNAMWARGEDGEVIARDLAAAFKYVVEGGVGKGKDIEEYKRLSKQ